MIALLVPGSILLCGLLYCILGWITINGQTQCSGSLHFFVYAIAIYGTVLLALYALSIILSRGCNYKYKNTYVYEHISLLFITTVINLVIFVVGIILLCTTLECQATFYYTVTIVFVVISGICFFNLLQPSRTAMVTPGSLV